MPEAILILFSLLLQKCVMSGCEFQLMKESEAASTELILTLDSSMSQHFPLLFYCAITKGMFPKRTFLMFV